MVLLTMTPAIVRALETVKQISPKTTQSCKAQTNPRSPTRSPETPSLTPNSSTSPSYSRNMPRPPTPLPHNTLLPPRTHLNIHPARAPTSPKSPEYTALMTRLRADQEALSYSRMLHPPPTREAFSQRFPSAANFSLGASAAPDSLDDHVSYEDVHRQIILIINILVSIVCVAVFVWVAARHWSVGKRLGLSMAGSVGVAVAEVAVYAGYVRKVQEAKRVERKKPEIKEIVRSWVIDKGEEKEEEVVVVGKGEADGVRFRKGKHR